jgi:hypothetical protein
VIVNEVVEAKNCLTPPSPHAAVIEAPQILADASLAGVWSDQSDIEARAHSCGSL